MEAAVSFLKIVCNRIREIFELKEISEGVYQHSLYCDNKILNLVV